MRFISLAPKESFLLEWLESIGNKIKKTQKACKPGSVPKRDSLKRLSFIYDLCRHKPEAIYPPTSDEQSYSVGILDIATHKAYGDAIAGYPGGLLPRLFTLIRIAPDGYFLLCYSTLADGFPLGSMALCVARTFLSQQVAATDRPTVYCKCKCNYFPRI